MNLHIDPTELRPVIEATVAEVLAQREADEARLGDRLDLAGEREETKHEAASDRQEVPS